MTKEKKRKNFMTIGINGSVAALWNYGMKDLEQHERMNPMESIETCPMVTLVCLVWMHE